MGTLETRTATRLEYAMAWRDILTEGRDLRWRDFYLEDIPALQAEVQRLQEVVEQAKKWHWLHENWPDMDVLEIDKALEEWSIATGLTFYTVATLAKPEEK